MSRLICRLSPRRAYVEDVTTDPSARLSHRDNDLDLDRYSAGQRAHADRRAGVPAAVAENLDEEIGTAVDHFGVVFEIRGGVHHAEYLDDVLDPVEVAAECVLHRRDQ